MPGAPAGPLEDFVARLHRTIVAFAVDARVDTPSVAVELVDGLRFALASVSAEPGFGFVTLTPHARAIEDDDLPERVVVPVTTIRRIELARAEEQRERFGFSLPAEAV